MINKLKYLGLVAAGAFFLQGCGDFIDPDDLIIVEPGMHFNERTLEAYNTIEVTSKANDAITLNNMTLNKGSCRVLGRIGKPTINYGETTKFTYNDECNVIHIEISTSKGDFEYSWDW